MIEESVKVSVIMPAYNAGKFISQSILANSLKTVRFLINLCKEQALMIIAK